ncbi:MAG TPA: hypothetical protein VD931_07905 [Baekduia sp.]|nr:hypothetical protein [Baekduia sp.]
MPRIRPVLAPLAVVAAGAVPAPAASAADLPGARDRAVDWAVTQVGHHERGTSNRSPRIDAWTRAMGLRVPPARPWCGSFVHEAFRRAGVRLSARLIDPHRSYADARAGRRGLRAIPVGRVRRGDLLFFRIRRGLDASHLAVVRSAPRGGRIATVEGNVSHAVRLKWRGVGVPVLAARVTG